MPNDFLKVAMQEHGEYSEAFDIANQYAVLAWGMCGSGSAMFCVSEDMDKLVEIEDKLSTKTWVAATERLD